MFVVKNNFEKGVCERAKNMRGTRGIRVYVTLPHICVVYVCMCECVSQFATSLADTVE